MYATNDTVKMPALRERIGEGGNAPVCLCDVTTPSGKTYTFACKVEENVSGELYAILILNVTCMPYKYRIHCTTKTVYLRKYANWKIMNILSLFMHT